MVEEEGGSLAPGDILLDRLPRRFHHYTGLEYMGRSWVKKLEALEPKKRCREDKSAGS